MNRLFPRFTLFSTLLLSSAAFTLLTFPVRADDAATHLALAQAAIAAKDVDKALAEFDAALVLEANNVSAHQGRFGILRSKGDLAGAIKELDRIIELRPQDAMAFKARSDLYGRTGDRVRAKTDVIAFLKLLPAEQVKLRTQAQTASDEAKKDEADKKKWQRAFPLWSLLLEVLPGDAPAHFGRGEALANAINYLDTLANDEATKKYNAAQAEAKKEFETAIQLDPTLVAAYIALTTKDFGVPSEEEVAAGLKVLDRGIQANPQSAELVMARAELSDVHGLSAKNAEFRVQLLAQYAHAVELEPNNIKALVGRAKWNFLNDKLPEALADATRALELQPDSFEALKLRAEIYNRAQDYPRSLADYNRAHALKPGDDSFSFSRFLQLRFHGDPKEALAAINELIQIEFDAPAARLARNVAAVNNLPQPKMRGPYRQYLQARAELYLDQKDFTRALADTDALLADRPAQEIQKLRDKILVVQKVVG